MENIYLYFSFFLIHIALGRKISIPYALAFGENVFVIIIIAFLLDIVQIPFFLYIYTNCTKIPIFKRFNYRIERRSKNLENSRLVGWARKYGKYGTIILAAMPIQGGGMWSGVLLAFILKLKRSQAYVLLSIGSLIGCIVIALGVAQIIAWL